MFTGDSSVFLQNFRGEINDVTICKEECERYLELITKCEEIIERNEMKQSDLQDCMTNLYLYKQAYKFWDGIRTKITLKKYLLE